MHCYVTPCYHSSHSSLFKHIYWQCNTCSFAWLCGIVHGFCVLQNYSISIPGCRPAVCLEHPGAPVYSSNYCSLLMTQSTDYRLLHYYYCTNFCQIISSLYLSLYLFISLSVFLLHFSHLKCIHIAEAHQLITFSCLLSYVCLPLVLFPNYIFFIFCTVFSSVTVGVTVIIIEKLQVVFQSSLYGLELTLLLTNLKHCIKVWPALLLANLQHCINYYSFPS